MLDEHPTSDLTRDLAVDGDEVDDEGFIVVPADYLDDDFYDSDDVDTRDDDDGRGDDDGDDFAPAADADPRQLVNELEEIPSSMIELDKIPPRLWEQTLAPLHPQTRAFITYRIPDERLRDIASGLALKLGLDDADRRNARDDAHHKARRTGYPLPRPDARHAATGPSVQVNIRLRADDHGRLAEAANAVGMRPTTLARALVLNGAARILQEHEGSDPRRTVHRRTHGYP